MRRLRVSKQGTASLRSSAVDKPNVSRSSCARAKERERERVSRVTETGRGRKRRGRGTHLRHLGLASAEPRRALEQRPEHARAVVVDPLAPPLLRDAPQLDDERGELPLVEARDADGDDKVGDGVGGEAVHLGDEEALPQGVEHGLGRELEEHLERRRARRVPQQAGEVLLAQVLVRRRAVALGCGALRDLADEPDEDAVGVPAGRPSAGLQRLELDEDAHDRAGDVVQRGAAHTLAGDRRRREVDAGVIDGRAVELVEGGVQLLERRGELGRGREALLGRRRLALALGVLVLGERDVVGQPVLAERRALALAELGRLLAARLGVGRRGGDAREDEEEDADAVRREGVVDEGRD